MGIIGVRLVRELNNISCLSLELQPKPKKRQDPASAKDARECLPRQATCVSRSFPHSVKTLSSIKEAIATHTTTVVVKLRKQKQYTTAITIFLLKSRFKDNYYSNSITLPLSIVTNRTSELINAALRGLELIYRDGYEYKKAGVIMQGLQSENIQQGNVFLQNYKPDKQQKLMKTIDRLNSTMGKNTVFWGVSGINQSWAAKKENISLRYTTCWSELPIVKASLASYVERRGCRTD
jgi:DNA polymerase V